MLPTERYLTMARTFAPTESNMALLTAVLANASYAVGHYLRPEARDRWRGEWLESSWAAMSAAEPGAGEQLAWARAVAAAATVQRDRAADLRAVLDGGATVPGLRLDPDLRWSLWTALAATGDADAADLDAELARDDTASGRTAHLKAMAARPDEDVKAQAWASALEDTSLTNDHLDAVIGGFRAGARRDLIARYDGEYFDSIGDVWASRSIEIARRIVVGLFPAADSLRAVDAWLDEHAEAPTALHRLVLEQRDHLARDLRVRGVRR